MGRQLFSSLLIVASLMTAIAAPMEAEASSRAKAIRMFRRIAGTPPSSEQIREMAMLIDAGRGEEAARIALSSNDFINNGAKRLVVGWTDVLGDTQKLLNYSSAMMIGAIRDDIPFDQVLYGEFMFAGDPRITSDETFPGNVIIHRILPRPFIANAGHFKVLDNNYNPVPSNPFLMNPQDFNDTYIPNLVQRIMTGNWLVRFPIAGFMDKSYIHARETAWALQPPYAGIMTVPDFAQAFYSGGTNRRPIKYLMQNFLCKDLDQLMDISLPDVWVRRDVDRSPGGDSRTYKQRCIGCHSGIDSLSGAFAHYDVNIGVGHIADHRTYGTRSIYPPDGSVPGSPRVPIHDKMNQNWKNYPAGHVVTDSSWENLWTGPKYADIGWRGATKGNGPKELGQMLARSEAFANCMATHVFKFVCQREPDGPEYDRLKSIARVFESDMNYSMKKLIARVSSQPECLGADQ